MPRISITGSEGFVGTVVKRMLPQPIPDTQCFDLALSHDLTQETTIDTICKRSDIVIHLAALSGLAICDKEPGLATAVNQTATIELAKRLKDSGAQRFIFSSSSAVYGEAQSYLMDELHPTEPRSHYGKTKLAAEQIIEFASKFFEVIILRPSNIYGYGLSWKDGTVLNNFIKCYLSKQDISINGSGSQKRDFVHIMDMARLYAKIATAPTIRSGIYNVGGNESVSMRALAEQVNDVGESVFGYRVPVTFKHDPNEVMYHDFRYSSEKAKHAFQYEPKFRIESYIQERMQMALRRQI